MAQRLSKDFIKASRAYMNVFSTRSFPNIKEEFQAAQKQPGKFERLHSDKKSATGGHCTVWIRYLRPPTKPQAGVETNPYFEAHIVIAAGDEYTGDTKNKQFEKMQVALPASIVTALGNNDGPAIAEAFKDTILKEWESGSNETVSQ
ncbi:uncharacterized protein STEHIDRAFT_155240 [Stereum hirsutum FP-91666 SS1]|uniref:uncharacterized protein n=1 Tax=Stereum hirsutum (strain FP-91666) TaxID=721885 RepID=UPI000440C319|nr:uncharacterized protein STEHIDRAFT_155240 [Stereum hirsutum FP-91666 SS1]EIM87877.1 hypothetical protein STEHIDRAFT_155240 [Stereum hirsutum FP-91666 SS1]